MIRREIGLMAIAMIAALLLAGCGEEDTIAKSTPQATAEAFAAAMQAGEYDKVAAGFDYETSARQENPDWDTFGESQRNLIVDKLQEDKAKELQAMAGMFAGGEPTVGNVQEQNGQAGATISAGANKLVLQMRQIEGKWLIANVYEGTGG
jgi:hypothetical protein